MAENRQHHFVPQFYLRSFSEDESGRSINIYNIGADRLIRAASVKGQCQKAHFYGEDPFLERGLSQVEGNFAELMRQLVGGKTLSSKDLRLWQVFISVQRGRTLAADKPIREWLDYMRVMLADSPMAEEVERDYPKIAADLTSESVRTHTLGSVMLYDLKMCLLENHSDIDFFTSDHPVVLANPAWDSLGGVGGFGLGSAGICIFTPLSPRVASLHYDGGVYQLDALGSRHLKVKRAADISKLNRWTVENCGGNLYFQDWSSGPSVRQACLEATEDRLSHQAVIREYDEVEPGKFESRPAAQDGGSRTSLLVFNVRQVQSRLNLSFFRPRSKPKFIATGTAVGPMRRGEWADIVRPLALNHGFTQKEMLRLARAIPNFSREVWQHFEDMRAELMEAADGARGVSA